MMYCLVEMCLILYSEHCKKYRQIKGKFWKAKNVANETYNPNDKSF